MTTITRQQFTSDTAVIDTTDSGLRAAVGNTTQAERAAIRSADRNDDGRIEGQAERSALFTALDQLERDQDHDAITDRGVAPRAFDLARGLMTPPTATRPGEGNAVSRLVERVGSFACNTLGWCGAGRRPSSDEPTQRGTGGAPTQTEVVASGAAEALGEADGPEVSLIRDALGAVRETVGDVHVSELLSAPQRTALQNAERTLRGLNLANAGAQAQETTRAAIEAQRATDAYRRNPEDQACRTQYLRAMGGLLSSVGSLLNACSSGGVSGYGRILEGCDAAFLERTYGHLTAGATRADRAFTRDP
jgi:hypothetical protein